MIAKKQSDNAKELYANSTYNQLLPISTISKFTEQKHVEPSKHPKRHLGKTSSAN